MLIGHANHPEVIGTIGQLSNESIHLIETANDAESYNNQYEKELAYITQTTLSIDDTAEIIKILKKNFLISGGQLEKTFVMQPLIDN